MKLQPSIRSARNVLFCIIGVLLLISIACFFAAQRFESDKIDRLWLFFSFNAEMSVPTYFSVLLLVGSAVLLSFIAFVRYKNRLPMRWYWAVLAAGFWFMSIDEFVGLHERFDGASKALGLADNLEFDWVVSGIIIVLATVVVYLPFLFKLPRATRNRFIIAGLFYVGGAVFIETIQSIYFATTERGASYIIFFSLEETCEMVGLVLFISALLGYIRDEIGEVRLSFDAAPSPQDPISTTSNRDSDTDERPITQRYQTQ